MVRVSSSELSPVIARSGALTSNTNPVMLQKNPSIMAREDPSPVSLTKPVTNTMSRMACTPIMPPTKPR